jgi:hypothetical protein
MAFKEGLIDTVDDPSNVGLGKTLSQGRQYRQAMNNVAQRARFDKSDPIGFILVQG